jgi:hypothetical protein
MKISAPLCFLMVLLMACKPGLEHYGEDFSELMKTDDGVFRGCNLGDSPETVQRVESAAPAASTPNSLTYEGSISDHGQYAVQYGFEKNALFEILVEATFDKAEQGMPMLEGFRKYFNERYGNQQEGNGYWVWKTRSGSDNCSIEMVTESDFNVYGQFSLNIYRDPGTPAINSNP